MLSQLRYSETSKIIRLFSMEHGLFTVMAKGALRAQSPFAGILEPFARLEIQVSLKKNREIHILTQAYLHDYYLTIRGNGMLLSAAETVLELVGQSVYPMEPVPELYRLLRAFLERLEKSGACSKAYIEKLLCLFMINELKIQGYTPIWQACSRCGSLDLGRRSAVSPSAGGALCRQCALLEPDVQWLTAEALDALARFTHLGIEQLDDLRLSESRRIEDLLVRFFSVHLDKKIHLKSLDYFHNF